MHASRATPSPALLGAAARTALLLTTGKPPLSMWRGPREGAREVTSRWPREGSERFTPSCKCQKSTAVSLQSLGHSMPTFPSAKLKSDSAWHSNLHTCCMPSSPLSLRTLWTSLCGWNHFRNTDNFWRQDWLKRLINLFPSAVIDHKGYLFNKGLELRFNWL